MAKRRRKEQRDNTAKYLELESHARARYVYFLCRRLPAQNWGLGYWWELIGPGDETICASQVFDNKADCLRSLRATQKHASTNEIRDDER